MTLDICLRCDWQGETKEPGCPNCGEQPLYVLGAPPSGEAGMPARGHPEERSREPASTASMAPPGTSFPQSNLSTSPTDAVGSSSRSARSAVAFVVAALVLIVSLGTWLKAHEERSAPAASTDAAVFETPASDGAPTLVVSPPPPGVGPIKPARIGKNALTVDGVPFSFSVPTRGWDRFGRISINKSEEGPQGAEAIIYWTSFPDGEYADRCTDLLSPPVGPSAADLAAAVSTAPGTELVQGPSDVTLGGRAAKHVVLTVRDNVGCRPGFFYAWNDVEAGPLWTRTGVGATIRVWIVDVGRTRLFIAAETTRQASTRIEHEIQQIIGSISFD